MNEDSPSAWTRTRLAGLAIGPLLALIVLLLPTPAALPVEAHRLIAVTALIACWWVTEALPIPVTSLLPIVLFPVLGILGGKETASQYAAVVPLFINAFKNGTPPRIHGDGEQTRDFVFVQDVVLANMSCLDAPDEAAGGVYNVARGEKSSVNDIAEGIARLMQSDVIAVHDDARPGDVRHSVGDPSKAGATLGWSPQTSFEEGLKQTIAYFTAGA